jgi:hypothetical protein
MYQTGGFLLVLFERKLAPFFGFAGRHRFVSFF